MTSNSPDDPDIRSLRVRLTVTPEDVYGVEYSAEASRILCKDDVTKAHDFCRQLPGYAPTPLVDHQNLADEYQVGSVLIKNEGQRTPTHSFKTLGPPYALANQLLVRIGPEQYSLSEVARGNLKPLVSEITTCAATSGNHGRALAWAAMNFGCQCRIYMPEATGAFREEQIQRFGATTIRVPGTFDDSVARAVADTEKHDYILAGNGAPPYSAVQRQIVHGYSVLGEELVSSTPYDLSATHVFIPAGGGSLAAALTGRLWMEYGANRPKIVIVQPHTADSAYQSCLKAARVPAQGELSTLMDGLSVRILTEDAWAILQRGAFGFLTIGEEVALATLRRSDRECIAIGETGITAVAGFIAAASNPDIRDQLALDDKSQVVLVATEGITDPGVLKQLISEPERY